jgi:two-component system LytT family response regulator
VYHVLIVDDEPLTRSELARILSTRSEIGSVESAADAVGAMEMLRQNHVDVLFLDVSMPELSGIEMLEMLHKRHVRVPAVIFVTAYSEHAVKAFDHHAADYVLKPFSESRIHAALDTAIHRTDTERVAKLVATLANGPDILRGRPERIAIKSQGRILFLDPSEVMFVQAEGNYVLLQTGSGSHLMRESLNQVEHKLAPYGFVRIHRSAIVNSVFVKEVQPWYTGEYVLKLTNGKEFTVTRTYKKNLRALVAGGIGTELLSTEDAKT